MKLKTAHSIKKENPNKAIKRKKEMQKWGDKYFEIAELSFSTSCVCLYFNIVCIFNANKT